MEFVKYFRKLMGWCPMKAGDWGEKPEKRLQDYSNVNQSLQKIPCRQEKKILKIPFSFVWDTGPAKILIPVLICSFVLLIYSPDGSFISLIAVIMLYLAVLLLVLRHRTALEITPDQVILLRPLFRPLMIRKKDIVKCSEKKNENHSLRWAIRLLTPAAVLFQALELGARTLQKLEESAPLPAKLSLFLLRLWPIALLLVLYYNVEVMAPYPNSLEIITRSKQKLRFYSRNPEELAEMFMTRDRISE